VALVNSSAQDDDLFLGQFCGGVLVSSTMVVTASHCVEQRRPDTISIVSGVADLCHPEAGSIHRTQVQAAGEVPNTGGQLTVLKLKSRMHDVPPTLRGPAKVPDGTAIALGWGRSEVGGVPSCGLRTVELDVTGNDRCASIAAAWSLSESQFFCTIAHGEVNTCDGDSGGPVFRAHDIGVTVAGYGCGSDDAGINILIDPRALRTVALVD